MLDTLRDVETPEGVALTLRAAGPVPRALAWLVDLFVRVAILFVLSMILGLIGTAGSGLWMVAFFLVIWAYPIAFELLMGGQTLGKRALGLRVVCDNGAPISWLPSIKRNLLRSVDMLPAFYGAGLASSLIDPHARRLGDIAAGTLVVHVDADVRSHHAPAVPPLMLPVPLNADEQVSLVSFAERATLISRERQEELANLLVPLTGLRGASGLQRLFGYANALLGRR
jgi:uncharacterized RDD family membrane protein YckC